MKTHYAQPGWIAVDFDGTLAKYDPAKGLELGEPIAPMVSLVRAFLDDGYEVRIFTARVGCSGHSSEHGTDNEEFCAHQRSIIQDWCEKHIGVRLEVTATKDFKMMRLYDDRAIRVEEDTGRFL